MNQQTSLQPTEKKTTYLPLTISGGLKSKLSRSDKAIFNSLLFVSACDLVRRIVDISFSEVFNILESGDYIFIAEMFMVSIGPLLYSSEKSTSWYNRYVKQGLFIKIVLNVFSNLSLN